jgi:hypothetical protein
MAKTNHFAVLAAAARVLVAVGLLVLVLPGLLHRKAG